MQLTIIKKYFNKVFNKHRSNRFGNTEQGVQKMAVLKKTEHQI